MTEVTKGYLEAEEKAVELAESTLATRKYILVQDKIELGNSMMAQKGIEIGCKVEIKGTSRWNPVHGVAIFDGYVGSSYGLKAHPKFMQVKKNGEASKQEFHPGLDYDVSPA